MDPTGRFKVSFCEKDGSYKAPHDLGFLLSALKNILEFSSLPSFMLVLLKRLN